MTNDHGRRLQGTSSDVCHNARDERLHRLLDDLDQAALALVEAEQTVLDEGDHLSGIAAGEAKAAVDEAAARVTELEQEIVSLTGSPAGFHVGRA
ncbi:hypothetical protein ACFVAJ_18420 [Agromyces sp. NPDC057679]|uniref:hypothetical protein n=1 Tax=Agromyces sp. NPDC057679 TaxID=3346207 RepID=UPI003671EB35